MKVSVLPLDDADHEFAENVFTQDFLNAAHKQNFFWYAFFVVLCTQRSIFKKFKNPARDGDDLHNTIFGGVLLALHEFKGRPIPLADRNRYDSEHGICARSYDYFLGSLVSLWKTDCVPTEDPFTYDRFMTLTSGEDNLDVNRIEQFKTWLVQYVLTKTDNCLWKHKEGQLVVSPNGTTALVPDESVYRERIRQRPFSDNYLLFAFIRRPPLEAGIGTQRWAFAELAFPIEKRILYEAKSFLITEAETAYIATQGRVRVERIIAGRDGIAFTSFTKVGEQSHEASAKLCDEIVEFLLASLNGQVRPNTRAHRFMESLPQRLNFHAKSLRWTVEFLRKIKSLLTIATKSDPTLINRFSFTTERFRQAVMQAIGNESNLAQVNASALRLSSLFTEEDLCTLVANAHIQDERTTVHSLNNFVDDNVAFAMAVCAKIRHIKSQYRQTSQTEV